jgi:hypothetical protein
MATPRVVRLLKRFPSLTAPVARLTATGGTGSGTGTGGEWAAEPTLLLSGVVLQALSLAAGGAAPTVRGLMLAFLPLAVGSSLQRTFGTALLTQTVGPGDQGAASGAADALEAVCRIFAPAVGGAVMQALGNGAQYFLGAALSAAGAVAFTSFLRESGRRRQEVEMVQGAAAGGGGGGGGGMGAHAARSNKKGALPKKMA